MTDSATPLPCPFCGSSDIHAQEGNSFRWLKMECQHCGACSGEARVKTIGPESKLERHTEGVKLAIAKWNTRAPS